MMTPNTKGGVRWLGEVRQGAWEFEDADGHTFSFVRQYGYYFLVDEEGDWKLWAPA